LFFFFLFSSPPSPPPPPSSPTPPPLSHHHSPTHHLKLPPQPNLHLFYPFHPTPTPKPPPNLNPTLAEPTPHPQPILPTSTHTLLPPSKLPYNSGHYSNHLLHLQFSQDDTLPLLPAFQDDPLENRCFYS
ncbi:hypothetical protein LINGRAHAP2_LOCUS31611, partial [Linum grandiflorum]